MRVPCGPSLICATKPRGVRNGSLRCVFFRCQTRPCRGDRSGPTPINRRGPGCVGNTGSKTTIHKYLLEIEVEEGGATQAVSDAFLALATQLAEQLKREATAELDEVRARMDDQRAADERVPAELEGQLGEARRAVNDVSRRLKRASRTLRPSKTSSAPRRSHGIPRSSACLI